MPLEKLDIERFLELSAFYPVIDVRSPGEYTHAHIPGAYSLPLFNNEERAVVGTAYKQESRETAIKHGLDFFGSKMKGMVEELEKINKEKKKEQAELNGKKKGSPDGNGVLLYCWRGGMRSGAVAWLFDLYGFKVYVLTGGYKKFRNHVLAGFKKPFSLRILGGYTGSGKTELLKELRKKGEPVIDLEDLAKHKGSAFGNIGMPQQPSQEMFENLLFTELKKCCHVDDRGNGNGLNHQPIWLEDESQRIGHVNIPGDLWKTMRRSPLRFIKISFEQRLNHIVEEYGGLDKTRMIDAVGRIRDRLGGLNAKKTIEKLENDDFKGAFEILLTYYDKWYEKGLHNREDLNSLLQVIKCSSVTHENAKKLIPRPVKYENP